MPANRLSVQQFWQKFQRLLLPKLFQYAGGHTQSFQYDERQQSWLFSAKESWRLFSIIPRQYYSEYHQTYPITELKDLRSVLNQQYSGRVMHLIGTAEHGQRHVTTFQFKDELFVQLKPPVFLIPESLLLANGLLTDFFTAVVQSEQQWFLARGPRGVVSQQPNKMVTSSDIFALATGLPAGLPTLTISSGQIAQHLAQGIGLTPLSELTGLFYGADLSKLVPNWRWLAAISASVLAIHMVFSSAILHWQIEDRQSQLTALGSDVDSLLKLQEDLQKQNTSLQLLNEQISTGQSAVPFWSLHKLLAEQKIHVEALSQQQNRIELRASAIRATDVLTLIQQQPWCKQASFSAPTRKVDANEQFQMRIELKSGGNDAKS